MITKRTITEKLDEEGRVIGRVVVDGHEVPAPIDPWAAWANIILSPVATSCTIAIGGWDI